MKRPVVFILLFLIYGIIGGQHLWGIEGVVLFILVGLAFALIIRKIYSLESAVLLVTVAFIGFILGFYSVSYTNDEIDALADTDAKPYMSCVVTDITGRYDYYSRYTVKLRYMRYKDKTYNEDIRLMLITPSDIEPGDIVSVMAKIDHGQNEFNEKYRMLSRHIEYKVWGDAFVTGHENSINTYMYGIREKTAKVYDAVMPETEAGILKAIILGDRLDIDDDVYELFKSAGIVHIIAISGLHISIFAAILMVLIGFMGKRTANICTLVMLFVYAVFTGGSPSVVRAVIMMYVFIIGSMLGRDYDIISSCSLACMILLIYSPCYIYDAGFQYSFTAVYAIGIADDILRRCNINNEYIRAFAVSLFVCFCVKPITLYYFGYINFVDVIPNIIVVSLMGILVFFGGMTSLVGFISVRAGIFISGLPYALLKGIEKLSQLSLGLPFSNIEGHIGGAVVAAIYILIIIAYLYIMNKETVSVGGDFVERTG